VRVGHWVAAVLLACSSTLAVVPGAVTPATADEPVCHISTLLVNSCRPWIGAASGGYGPSSFTARMANHEARIGRQLDVVHTYLQARTVITPDIASMAKRPGTIALVNWRPAQVWANAAGGDEAVNAQIDDMAASIKALGSTKIMLSIHHEAERDISPGGDPSCPTVTFAGSAGSVSDYVAMWQNIRSRFDALGVDNVVWVMNYMGYKSWNCVVKDLWPGNDYVDWVTWDPYTSAASWSSMVGTFYSFLTANSDEAHDFMSKPWGLSEFGFNGANQTIGYQFYDDALKGVRDGLFPKLKMLAVWDSKTNSSDDVRLQYTSKGVVDQVEQDHYNAFVNDPVLNGPATVDATPPTVTLTSPVPDTDGLQGSIEVAGLATDDGSGVASATLLVDDAPAGAVSVGQDGVLGASWNSFDVADGQHTLRLRVKDAAGNSSTSDPVTVGVSNGDDQTPPSQPGALTAEVDGVDVVLSWAPATDDRGVTSYLVYRDGDVVKTLAGTALTYRDTGLPDGSTHTYTVTATDKVPNESAHSDPASAEIGDNTAPAAPVASASLVGGNGAHVTWTPPADADGVVGYDVFRNGTSVMRIDDPGVSTYDDTGLAEGRTFGYTVVSRDAAGNASVPSNLVSVTTLDVTRPSAPTNLVGTVSGTTVKLTWKAATDNVGVKSYTVFRNGVPIASPTGLSYTDSSPRTGLATYLVMATDAAGNQGPSSNTARVTFPDKVAPSTPTLKGVAGVRNATLTWTAATDNVGVTRYDLYRGGVKYKQLGAVTRFVDTGLITGRTYAYRVYAVDAAGNSSVASNQVSVKAK
jgi:fibronectin type 3 domain-containing protein